jgi:hypothetical protein
MIRLYSCLAAVLAACVLGACEPDDPKVRQEVADLRVKIAELEKQNAVRQSAQVAAQNTLDSIPRETLSRSLEDKMPVLRTKLITAFPGYQVDTVNAATIVTPQDSDYLPYTTELSFGLAKGPAVASFSIRIGADRGGNWQLPNVEQFAASVGNLASSDAASQVGPSGRGATINNNVRQIEWGNTGGSLPAPSSYSGQHPAEEIPQQSRQPSGNAPFPVQDTRTIQFE